MNKDVPRLRMFAGPNRSGKSTFKTMIIDAQKMEIKGKKSS